MYFTLKIIFSKSVMILNTCGVESVTTLSLLLLNETRNETYKWDRGFLSIQYRVHIVVCLKGGKISWPAKFRYGNILAAIP